MYIQRLKAQHLIELADKNEQATAPDRAGAEKYLEILNTYCIGKNPRNVRCDEIAYNAASSFIAATDSMSARSVYAIMLDPKNKMNSSPLTVKLGCKLTGSQSRQCH